MRRRLVPGLLLSLAIHGACGSAPTVGDPEPETASLLPARHPGCASHSAPQTCDDAVDVALRVIAAPPETDVTVDPIVCGTVCGTIVHVQLPTGTRDVSVTITGSEPNANFSAKPVPPE
jgi:hypothetical protein